MMAERQGFEPWKRFWHLHTFQACSFDHSDTSPEAPIRYGMKERAKVAIILIRNPFFKKKNQQFFLC